MTGRPIIFTQDLADAVCDRLAAGQTLREVCRADDVPSSSTVRRWVLADPDGFGKQYAAARELGWQEMADEILEISDDASGDWTVKTRPDGSSELVPDHENVQRSRLRTDSRKWLLSKVLPKTFGDKLAVDHSTSLSLEELVVRSGIALVPAAAPHTTPPAAIAAPALPPLGELLTKALASHGRAAEVESGSGDDGRGG